MFHLKTRRSQLLAGRCYLKKYNMEKDISLGFSGLDSAEKSSEMACVMRWVPKLNAWLSKGGLFEDGIPTDSALLTWLVMLRALTQFLSQTIYSQHCIQ